MNRYSGLMRRLLRVHPRSGQMLNLLKCSAHFAAGHFPARLCYAPVSFGVHVTNRCNLDCPFCYNRAVHRADLPDRDLSPAEFEQFLDHPDLRQAVRVAFTGGEPLPHPHLFEFVEQAHSRRMLTYVTTNGLLVEARLDELGRSLLDTVQLSLYDEHVDRQVENARRLRDASPGRTGTPAAGAAATRRCRVSRASALPARWPTQCV